jgi:hypothetical protein
MRSVTMLGLLAATLAFDAGTGTAGAAPWCAWYTATASDCGYFTHQACLDTVRGAGGWCARNVYELATPYGPPPQRRKHWRRDRY